MLGIVGAILNFCSGSTFLSMSMSITAIMNVTTTHYNPRVQGWDIFLLALGVVLVRTLVLSATSLEMKHLRLFGSLIIG